jgi:thioredoxin 1
MFPFARCRSTKDDEDFMSGYKSMDRIQTVTASSFDRLVLKGEGPIVVEFMSYGCAHCGVIEPDLQQVAEIVESTEKIFRVNIAVDQELAESYEIQGTPTLIMFLNGAIVGRDEGPSPDVSNILALVTQPYES